MSIIKAMVFYSYFVFGVFTMLEYYFIHGLFTAIFLMFLMFVLGVLNIMFRIKERQYTYIALYALCTTAIILPTIKAMY